MITIIIPTYNESKSGFLPKLLASLAFLQDHADFEIYFVDGSSTDNTCELITNAGFSLIAAPKSNRAHRFNVGLKRATGELIVLHHPRSYISKNGYLSLRAFKDQTLWGAFRHSFDQDHPLLQFTSFYSQNIRLKFFHIAYLDHCLFASRDLLDQIGGVPERDIFEDTELSKALRRLSRPTLIQEAAVTSAIRFRQNGLVKQVLLNQLLKIAYHLKFPDAAMNRIYEKSVGLNPTKGE